MPTNWDGGLLPEAVAARVLAAVQEQSAVMSLANVRPMPAGIEHLPLQTSQPKAQWLEKPGDRKPYVPIEWSAERLVAREVALTTFVEDAYLDDSAFDIESETERALDGAIAAALDAALLFGEDAPPGFPPNGIVTAPVSGDDGLDALDKALAVVEASGVAPSGVVAGPAIASALRAAYRDAGALPGANPTQEVYGLPVRISPIWDASKGDAIVGAFEFLVVGVRSDISVETSTDGVLMSPDGDVIANAFQDDVTLVRAHARFAAAVGKPIGASGNAIVPFATAKWTTAAAGASEPELRGPGPPRREVSA